MKSVESAIDFIFYGKFKHISRFSIVGVLNTLVDFLMFTISHSLLGIGYVLSQAIGYSCGIINSFIINKKWTFKDTFSNKKSYKQLLQFIVINVITLLITMVSMNYLVTSFNINVYVAKIAVTLLAQVINFFGYKIWVFN